MSQTPNYTEQGGARTVVGGELVIESGGKLLFGDVQATPLEPIPDTEVTTVAALRDEYNRLLAALRAAGLMRQ